MTAAVARAERANAAAAQRIIALTGELADMVVEPPPPPPPPPPWHGRESLAGACLGLALTATPYTG